MRTRGPVLAALLVLTTILAGSTARAQPGDAPALIFLGVPATAEAPTAPLPWLVPYAFRITGSSVPVLAAAMELRSPAGAAKDPPVHISSPSDFILWADRLEEPSLFTIALTFPDGTELTNHFLHHGVTSGRYFPFGQYGATLGTVLVLRERDVNFMVGEGGDSVIRVRAAAPCGSRNILGGIPADVVVPINRGRFEYHSPNFGIRAVFRSNQMAEGYVRVRSPEGRFGLPACESGWHPWIGIDRAVHQ